jgi:prepilin-type N-terminal cleavage/methylation domain-containing protein
MKIKTIKKQAGFTLVEIMIVVAIIGLLAAIAIPNFVKARATAQANGCINNMRIIDGSISQWALENHQSQGATVPNTTTLANLGYLRTPGGINPQCPASGSYTTSTLGSSPSVACSLGNTVTPPHIQQ